MFEVRAWGQLNFWEWLTNPRCRSVLTRHECEKDSKVDLRYYHPDEGKPPTPPPKPHEDDKYLLDDDAVIENSNFSGSEDIMHLIKTS